MRGSADMHQISYTGFTALIVTLGHMELHHDINNLHILKNVVDVSQIFLSVVIIH